MERMKSINEILQSWKQKTEKVNAQWDELAIEYFLIQVVKSSLITVRNNDFLNFCNLFH